MFPGNNMGIGVSIYQALRTVTLVPTAVLGDLMGGR